MFNIEIQSHNPLRDVVYEEIRHHILHGGLKPRTRLMEIDIAKEMGVSRTPIREAIRKLEKEGLVVIEARRGAYVADISTKDMLDILDVRATLEGLAASLAAQRMDELTLKKLEKTKDLFKEAVAKNEMQDMIKYDTDFHHILVESTSNERLKQMVESLQELVLRFRYIYYKDFKRAEDMIPEHEEILLAIKHKDPKMAQESAFNHIDRLKQMVLNDNL